MSRRLVAAAIAALVVTALASARVGLGLFERPPVAALPMAAVGTPPLATRALIVVVDGLRADIALDGDGLPIARELAARGAAGVLLAEDPTMTGAGVRVLGTGEPPVPADILHNDSLVPIAYDSLFAVLRGRGYTIGVAGDHSWADLFGASITANETKRVGGLLAAMRPVYAPDEAFVARALALLSERRTDVTVLHVIGTDAASHTFGPRSRLYAARLAVLDRQIRTLIAACGGCLVALTSDHGASDAGHHGLGEDIARRTPLVLAGPGVRVGARIAGRQVDFAPTIAALLGVAAPSHAHGRTLIDALAVDPRTAAALAMADAERLGRLADRPDDLAPARAARDAGRFADERALAERSSAAAVARLDAAARTRGPIVGWALALLAAAAACVLAVRVRSPAAVAATSRGKLALLVAIVVAVELAFAAWRIDAEWLRRTVVRAILERGGAAWWCNVAGVALAVGIAIVLRRVVRAAWPILAIPLAGIGDVALPWVAAAILAMACGCVLRDPASRGAALAVGRVREELSRRGWLALGVLAATGAALRIGAPMSAAMIAWIALAVIATLAATAWRLRAGGWVATVLLEILCEPPQLPALAVVVVVVRSARFAASPLGAAAIVVAARVALIFAFEGAVSYSHLEWSVGRFGNPTLAPWLAHALVALKFALPALVLVGHGVRDAHVRPALAWCIALALVHQAHALVSLALTIGQYHTPFVDLTEALFASAIAGSFAVVAIVSRASAGGSAVPSARAPADAETSGASAPPRA